MNMNMEIENMKMEICKINIEKLKLNMQMKSGNVTNGNMKHETDV